MMQTGSCCRADVAAHVVLPCEHWWRRAASRFVQAMILILGKCLMDSAMGSGTTSSCADYTVQNWQIEDGLPQNSVESIVQTPDGYLWLATYAGLARFDGVRFAQFDASNLPGLPGNRPERLYVDREGALWVIAEQHEVACVKAGECRTFGAAQGVPAAGAKWVGEDGQGCLWLAGIKAGLWRWQNGRFVVVPSSPAFADSPIRCMVTDTAGRPWFNHRDRLFGLQNGALVRVPRVADRSSAGVRRVCARREGGLWVITPEALRKNVAGSWLPEAWPCPDFQSSVVDLCEDQNSNLWVATFENGLFRFNPTNGWLHFSVESGLPTRFLCCLFCDREGNVWVGTDGSGLLKIKPRFWKTITRREGLNTEGVQSIGQDQAGRIWLAGGTKGPYCWENGMVSAAIPAPLAEGLDSAWVILPARDGAIWIGTYVAKLFEYRDGALIPYTQTNGMMAGSVRALLQDRQGRIWVGGFEGLSRVEHGRFTHFSEHQGLSSKRVWALAEGAASACLYIGTDGGGLDVLQDGRITCYARQNGLPDDYITCLYVDAEDALWIGTHGGGLSRFQAGRFFNYRVKGGLPVRRITTMLEDDAGRLWMGTEIGIVCADRRDLSELAAGRRHELSFVAFDRSDGLETVEVGGVQPSSLKARDGKLWFCTGKGAAFADARELRFNQVAPPVIIEEVRIDDRVLEELSWGTSRQNSAARRGAASSACATLRPREHRLELRFTGLSYAAPSKVRFRYRMEGFDPDWVEGGTVRSATYTRLPPGCYRFCVTACNDSSLWNETGASLGVVVVPAFHQTWWFWLLVLAAVAGLGSAFFLLRLARHNQLARLRGRIAGDLHDEIGSNLGGIILLSELAQQATALPPDARASLQEINVTAQRSATAMRDIVWFLNPDFDTLADMVARMREFAATLLGGVACEFTSPDLTVARNLPLEFRRNVFFAFKEILHNIVKHAEASRVSIRIEVGSHQFILRVQDNGHGFDPAQATSGHGLRSLRRRAVELGGQLTTESGHGKGTTIVLTVMLP
jgi:ligand-binding sensor domain-containing protein/signal transduction histidine kinase